MKKSFIILTVLALLLISVTAKPPTAEGATNDLEITKVKYIRTTVEPYGPNYLITVYLNVTWKNSGTAWINITEKMSYGSTLVHESRLNEYLNHPGQLDEPFFMGDYKYKSLAGWYTSFREAPGVTGTEQREIVIITAPTSPWPLAGKWYLFSWIGYIDDNTANNLPWQASTPQDSYIQLASGSVGGFVIPVDKFGLLAPYLGLASTAMIGAGATAIYVKRVKRRKEKQ